MEDRATRGRLARMYRASMRLALARARQEHLLYEAEQGRLAGLRANDERHLVAQRIRSTV